jgi:hypothetical protein
MIRYDLICEKGHEFDGWFSDSASYEKQAKRGFVECTHCGSNKVQKQLMAPNVGVKSNKKSSSAANIMAGPVDPRIQQMAQMVREIRAHVEKNSEHVGDRFAEEARKIHYGEAEERGIYGNATGADVRGLLEEGIDVHPLPRLPEDGH